STAAHLVRDGWVPVRLPLSARLCAVVRPGRAATDDDCTALCPAHLRPGAGADGSGDRPGDPPRPRPGGGLRAADDAAAGGEIMICQDCGATMTDGEEMCWLCQGRPATETAAGEPSHSERSV